VGQGGLFGYCTMPYLDAFWERFSQMISPVWLGVAAPVGADVIGRGFGWLVGFTMG